MSSPFDSINAKNKVISESLINGSDRAASTATPSHSVSLFDKSFQHATTFNSGKCIPIFYQEVYPGDTYEIDTYAQIKQSTPASTPLMNVNYDINYFFVPYEQIDPDFKYLMGENPDYGYSVENIGFPQLIFDTGTDHPLGLTYNENDLASYLGVPVNTDFTARWNRDHNKPEHFNIYPFLAYGKVYNDWYRDQNVQSSVDITSWKKNTDRKIRVSNFTKDHEDNYLTSLLYGKGLAPASKLPDIFTTCLPYRQKGEAVQLGDLSGLVIDNMNVHCFPNDSSITPTTLYFVDENGDRLPSDGQNHLMVMRGIGGSLTYAGNFYNSFVESGNACIRLGTGKTTGAISGKGFLNVNDLRYSLATQHLYEYWALNGSRLVEQLKSIWGIEIDPKLLGRSELIGGYSDVLVFNNIRQTSATEGKSPLGKIGSSLYNGVGCEHITYSSAQHGIILGIAVCRTSLNNGGQGLPHWCHYIDRLDLWNPIFNGIGEEPIYTDELAYFPDANETDIFGYNEPWIWTKLNYDNASGFLSLKSKTSLFSNFLFGVNYSKKKPALSSKWMEFDPSIIGNTLFLPDSTNCEFYHQFIGFFSFKVEYITQQPLFNQPGIKYI